MDVENKDEEPVDDECESLDVTSEVEDIWDEDIDEDRGEVNEVDEVAVDEAEVTVDDCETTVVAEDVTEGVSGDSELTSSDDVVGKSGILGVMDGVSDGVAIGVEVPDGGDDEESDVTVAVDEIPEEKEVCEEERGLVSWGVVGVPADDVAVGVRVEDIEDVDEKV